jgi:DNA repair protein RecN (Recombination protein N)
MLRSLNIKNFVIIEDQHIEFGDGLNVLSGESGSGKSIILDALELLLGARAKGDFFRAGTEAWELEALFELDEIAPEVLAGLPDMARAVLEDSSELVLSRSLARNGKARCFIGGKLATVKMLAEVGGIIMSICTQRESLILLDPNKQLSLLDDFANTSVELEHYRTQYSHWRAQQRALEKFLKTREASEIELARSREVVEELSPLREVLPRKEEIETLIRESAVLGRDVEGIARLREICLGEAGILAMLSHCKREMRSLSSGCRLREELSQSLDQLAAQADEFDLVLARSEQGGELSEAELEQLRSDLSEIARLERKHRQDWKGLLALLQSSEESIRLLESPDGGEASVRKAEQDAAEQLAKSAKALRRVRKAAAKELSQRASSELAELGFVASKLSVELEEADPGPDGFDAVRILFQANPGEPEKLLEEVASGGEISRLMLVLRSLISSKSGTQVLVFDEVDSGVSGIVARAMGRKLRELGSSTQVLCVSHLPQVASLANRHFVIRKEVGKRTRTLVLCLETEADRVEEIARMLSGYTVTDAARESARELIASKDERGLPVDARRGVTEAR